MGKVDYITAGFKLVIVNFVVGIVLTPIALLVMFFAGFFATSGSEYGIYGIIGVMVLQLLASLFIGGLISNKFWGWK